MEHMVADTCSGVVATRARQRAKCFRSSRPPGTIKETQSYQRDVDKLGDAVQIATKEVLSSIARNGYFLSSCSLDEPHEESLLKLVVGLGDPEGNESLHVPGFKHGCVDIISPVSGVKTYRDGTEIRSTTNHSMLCHTDGSTDVDPIDLLVMFVSVGDTRVKTVVAHVDDVISRLDSEQIATLRRRIFPFSNQLFPILKWDGARHTIRYDRFEVDRAKKAKNHEFDQVATTALLRLDDALEDASQLISLEEGDLIVMDNHRMLHGRTEIPIDSQRILMRVRLRTQTG